METHWTVTVSFYSSILLLWWRLATRGGKRGSSLRLLGENILLPMLWILQMKDSYNGGCFFFFSISPIFDLPSYNSYIWTTKPPIVLIKSLTKQAGIPSLCIANFLSDFLLLSFPDSNILSSDDIFMIFVKIIKIFGLFSNA